MLAKNRSQKGLIRSLARALCLSAISMPTVGFNAVIVNQNTIAQTKQAVLLSNVELKPYIETYAELVYRNYQDSRKQAVMMEEAISTFLDQPNETTHNAAKEAWTKARQSYLQTEAFRFYEGPID